MCSADSILSRGSWCALTLLLLVGWTGVSATLADDEPVAAVAEAAPTEPQEVPELPAELELVPREETDEVVIEFQGFANGIPRFYITHNATAADSISTDECRPGGSSGLNLTGAGVTLGIWDAGGVRLSHQEFGGRATQMDSPGGTHYHSTHVGGTMIAAGVVASAKGMSPSANLNCWEWNSDTSEMRSAAASGLRVSNHSYGYATGWTWNSSYSAWFWYGDVTVSTVEDNWFGLYTSYTQEYDDVAWDYLYYLICKSAGNDRNDDGPGPGGGHYYWNPGSGSWQWSTATRNPDGDWECLGTTSVGKNILLVGAVEDVPGGYAGPGSVTMSSFSSWGPTDDGRIKPDICGNGVGLYSCVDSSNSAYASYSGTSMSTPNVSGSLGLLIDHWRDTHAGDMRSATLKGLVVHTADECGPGNGPDYMFGWGLMNTLEAAYVISDDVAVPLTITENTISTGGTFELYATTDGSSSQLRATICWTDPPGTPPGENLLDPPNLMLVNDLDLRIIAGGSGTTYYPWVLNPASPGSAATTGDNYRDNVEQVVAYSPGSGTYTIRITPSGSLSGSQSFSLIISGAASISTSPVTYTLTVNVTGSGSVSLNPPGGTYLSGTTVQLTANAAGGWHFDHWEGHLTGSNNPESLLMNGNKTVTAVFVQDQYTLTVNVTGSGSVSLNPPGGTYLSGTTVQLTANAAGGWHFDHWEGHLTGSNNPESLLMDGNKTVTAVFVQDQYTLTVNVTGSGSVSLNPPGGTYPSGTTVQLTANAAGGWHFDHWEGHLTGSTNPQSLLMDGNKTVTAVFVQDQYTLTVNVTGSGSVSLNPPGGTYPSGTTVQLTANAAGGWHFDHWEGHLTGSTNPESLLMDGNKTVTAVFVEDPYVLSVGSMPLSGVSITVSPVDEYGDSDGVTPFQRYYYAGPAVTLAAPARPAVGSDTLNFLWWSVNGIDQPEDQLTVVHTVAGDAALAAEYVIIGDMNADSLVNAGDIPAFVLALTDRAAYTAQYGPYADKRGDFDGDGACNAGDIPGFVARLTGE